jgi:hypothetical protein
MAMNVKIKPLLLQPSTRTTAFNPVYEAAVCQVNIMYYGDTPCYMDTPLLW